MKEFIIPFFGLKQGLHEFNFKIDQTFFDAFESNLIEDPDIDVKFEIEIMSTMLIMTFEAVGTFVAPCDRCGEYLKIPITADERTIVKFGDETYDQTDEIIMLSHNTHEIDISHRIYEMLVLAIPNKRVHPSIEDCDADVLNHDDYKEESEEEEELDPRWDALKKLK